MHSSVSVRYAPVRNKRKRHVGAAQCGVTAAPTEQMSSPHVEDRADREEDCSAHLKQADREEENCLAHLKHAALKKALLSVSRALMTVPVAHRPASLAGLLNFIRKRARASKAFVIDPVEVVQLLLANKVFQPAAQGHDPDVAANTFADALVLLLSPCRPCPEYLVPITKCPHAQVILQRARAVELYTMSLRAAARFILSQSFILIDVAALHVVTALCNDGALCIDDGQSGDVTYSNLHLPGLVGATHFFDLPCLPEDAFDHSNVGMEILDKSGKSLGLVKEDIGVMVRAAQSGEVWLKSEVMLQRHRRQRMEVYHLFQRCAYLNKTFGKGVKGATFGKSKRKRKKGVRKLPAIFSCMHSKEPKNASARQPMEADKNRYAESAVRRAQHASRRNECESRTQSRDDKYFAVFDSSDDYTLAQASKGSSRQEVRGWDVEWLASWAVEEDLEYWHKHAMKSHLVWHC